MPEVTVYRAGTALPCLLYLTSAFLYVTNGTWTRQAPADLGYPAYLVPVMAAVKVAGPAAILARFSVALSGLAHLGVRKPLGARPAVIGLALLAASFTTRNAARAVPSPYPLAAAF